MAATKSATTLVASATSAAGAAVDAATGSINLTTAYGATLTARVTNGATGPTVGCTVNIYISTDGSSWRKFWSIVAPLTASGVFDYAVQIPETVMYAEVGFGGNTGQNVTIESYAQVLTGI